MQKSNTSLKSFLKAGSVMVGLVSTIGLATCGGTTEPAVDMSVPADMTFFSCCGKPGDTGNSKGVGKYCKVQADCNSGTLCAYVFQPQKQSYFCLVTCSGASDTTTCGENATCTQDSSTGAYGCVPSACLANKPAGCTN